MRALCRFLSANLIVPALLAVALLPQKSLAIPPSNVEILEDRQKKMSLNEVQNSSDWKPAGHLSSLGFTKSRLWLRISPPSVPATNMPYILNVQSTSLGKATLYEWHNSELLQSRSQGQGIPLDSEASATLVTGSLAFQLISTDISQSRYLLSIEGDIPLSAPIEFVPAPDFGIEQRWRLLFLGMFFGALGLSLVFNAFLGIWLKSGLYVVYSLFTLSIFFLFLAHERLSIQLLWPQSPQWSLLEMHISGGFVVLFYALFVRSFLNTSQRTPWLDHLMMTAVLVSSLRSVWLIFDANQAVVMVGQTAIVMVNFLILAIATTCLAQGHRAAKYFFVSSFVYNLSVILFILHSSNVINLPPWVDYSPHFGILSEVILLSLALADRIRMNNLQLEGTVDRLDAEIQRRELTEVRLQKQQMDVVQAEKMSALGRMAAGIAHEINNPLAIISTYAEHLQNLCGKDPLPVAKIREVAPRIEVTIQRISRIIKSMRTLARDSSLDPFVKVPLSAIFQDIQSLCQERFRHHAIDLKIAPVPSEISTFCRSPEICQVLVNLLNNAFDALQSKANSADAKQAQVDWKLQNQEIIISVSNNGPAIPEQLKNKIYEPFFTTKDIGQGTGLGLSISRTLIENHKGRLWVETSNHRTCFHFTLPLWNEEMALIEPFREFNA